MAQMDADERGGGEKYPRTSAPSVDRKWRTEDSQSVTNCNRLKPEAVRWRKKQEAIHG